jgi:hypothetical protein
MELSRARIDRLGEAIKSGDLNDVDQSVFSYLRSQWAELGNEISNRLILEFGNDNFGVSLRLKNLETIRAKLMRTTLRLSSLRDVVGARIVVNDGLILQNDSVLRSVALFGDCTVKIIYRREFPSFGYRAVHVEVRHGLYLGEIQIRTPLLHEWARSMESLARLVSRDVRYGGEPVVDTYSPVVRNLLLISYRNLVELGRRIEISEVGVLNDTAELFQGLITINSLVIEIERKVR